MVQKPKQTQRLAVTGRARRSKTLQDHKPGGDPRGMRDASAAARGDDYEFPIEVDQTASGRRKVRLRTTMTVDPILGLVPEPAAATFVPSKYEETFGDNAASTFTITHSLGTQDLTGVTIYEVSSGDVYVPDVSFTDANTVDLDFGATVPTNNQYRIVISA